SRRTPTAPTPAARPAPTAPARPAIEQNPYLR
ncbi:MAG: hypothetical protein JWM10_1114, partial [Myxococcaceae bacterium]|nr:hypothetical protein [Myxococcaceae bacterium]